MAKKTQPKNVNKPPRNRTIKVDYLARVEGEGGLDVRIRNGVVKDVKLRIFEPPRFFEAFMRGRAFSEAPDITARICGICPIAYQMSSVHAMEQICGVKVEGTLRELRRLLYCGEWIESHVLHAFMLHAPDFLGYEDAIQMARDHPEAVNNALRVKKIGNELVTLLGGREIHPINVRVGGFYKAPTREQLKTLVDELAWGRDTMRKLVDVLARLDFPAYEQECEYVALSHPDEYPYNEGRLVSDRGLDIPIEAFYEHFEEEHVAHSTSLHARRRPHGGVYCVGPQARFNLNFEKLSPLALEAARAAKLAPPCRNPFQSILVRAIETIFAFEEALRIIDGYREPPEAAVPVQPKAGTGHGCTEAPRGILYHRYRTNAEGLIEDARIVPPTSQNQKSMEADLQAVVEQFHAEPEDKLTWKCEQTIRNYDPCISCSCHFLKLTLDRGDSIPPPEGQ